MAGDAIEQATSVLLEELVSFSPNPRDRANLGRVLQATGRVMDKARDLVEKRLDALVSPTALDELATRVLSAGETAGTPSTAAPAPSALTPLG
jgi:hypothetical protein